MVEFNPKKEDDQKFLSCQARNELIDDIAVEDQWKITVYCKLSMFYDNALVFFISMFMASMDKIY